MGLFDKIFTFPNSVDKKISLDAMLDLVTISNKSFDKVRCELEKIIFFDDIISPDIPLEYQKDRVDLQEEFKNRFIISSGIISLSLIDYLVNKKCGNEYNKAILIALYKKIFPNLLKIRDKVISRNLDPQALGNYEFNDEEPRIEYNNVNENKFFSLINSLSLEINHLIELDSDLKIIRNYFGYSLGQIFVSGVPEKNEKIAEVIRSRIKVICADMENNFFGQL